MLVEPNSERTALRRFWSGHAWLVGCLTGVWAGVSFLPPLVIGSSRARLFGVPLSMWFMAELAPIAFVGIAWVYARRADTLDAEYVGPKA